MRILAFIAALLTGTAFWAGAAQAQNQVDMRVNLSTQPVYGGYKSPSSSYFGQGDLYTTGNVRGGRALQINRTFLEDRFFSGSLTRFFRDTVSASDVSTPGYSAGQAQPYFRPGSLTVSGSNVGTAPVTGGMSPFGLSFNPAAALPSPFSVSTLTPPPTAPTRAQFPTSTAQRTYEIRTEIPLLPTPSNALGVPRPITKEPQESLLPVTPTTESLFAPKPAEELRGPGEAAPPPTTPEGLLPAPPPQEGLRPMDYLRQRFGEEKTEEPGKSTKPGEEEKLDLGPAPGEKPVEPHVTLSETRATTVERPRRFYEQYMTLGLEELKDGSYRPAADAFSKAADFNLLDPWSAKYHEAVTRLMMREYAVAAFQAGSILKVKPAVILQGPSPQDLVKRADEWKAVEADLREGLRLSPKSSDHALCLAWLLVRSGRGEEAGPLLTVAAANPAYAAAVNAVGDLTKP